MFSDVTVKVSDDLSWAKVTHPGFQFMERDRNANVPPWRLLKMAETPRVSSWIPRRGQTNVFFRHQELRKKYLIFVKSTSVLIYPRFYEKPLFSETLQYTSKIVKVGNSSVKICEETKLARTGETLWQCLLTFVTAGLTSRSLEPLPKWFTDEFKSLEHPAPPGVDPNMKHAPQKPPDAAFSYSSKVEYSDLDGYFHMNQSNYIMKALDAAAVASVQGFLIGFTGDLGSRYVKEMHVVYLQETRAGDELVTRVWQTEGQLDTVHCSITTNDTFVFCSNFIFQPSDDISNAKL